MLILTMVLSLVAGGLFAQEKAASKKDEDYELKAAALEALLMKEGKQALPTLEKILKTSGNLTTVIVLLTT